MKAAVCRECKIPVAGLPHVSIGETSADGGARICVTCVVQLQRTNGVPSQLDRLVDWYKKNRVSRTRVSQIKLLRERLAEAEQLLREAGVELD